MAPRTPLLRPDSYFAERDLDLARGLVVAGVVVLAAVALARGLVAVLLAKLDGTVMVDNPERPPEGFCTGGTNETFAGMDTGFNCSAPAEVERNIDPIVRDAAGEFYGVMLVGMVLVVVGVAVGLHVGTALAGGEGGFGNTLAVTAWGFAPTLVTIPLGVAALYLLMEPVTVTPSTAPSALQDAILDSIRPWRPVALALNLVSSAWGAAIWTFGLERGRSVSRRAAAALAVAAAGLFALGALR